MPTDPLYFFSYSRQELYFAESAVVAMQKAGLNIWFDLQQLEPGCVWGDEIARGLEQCAGVILLASRASLNSPWVAIEWEKALNQGKPIYILLFEAVSFDPIPASSKTNDQPIPLDNLKKEAEAIIDIRRNFTQNIARLTAVVKEQGKHFDPIPTPNRWHIPTRMPIAVALVALSLALMTIVMLWISLYGFSIYWPMMLGGLLITAWLADRTLAFLQRRSFREPRGLLPIATLLSPLISLALTPFFAIGALLVHFSPDVERWSPLGQGTDRHRARASMPSRRFRRAEPSGVTYQIIAAPEDSRVAVHVEREMRRAGHELIKSAHAQDPPPAAEKSDRINSDFTILILSNYTPEAIIQSYAQSDEKVICVAASALNDWNRFKPVSQFQFVDYRRQQHSRLAAMALDILNISGDQIGHSFSTHLTPEQFNKIILPARVASAIGLMYVSLYIFSATTIRNLFTGGLSPLFLVLSLLTNVIITIWLMIRATQREITVSLLVIISMGIFIFNILLGLLFEPSLRSIDLVSALAPTLLFNLIFYIFLYGIFLSSWLPARLTPLRLSVRRDIPQWRFHFMIMLVLALFAVTFLADRFVYATTPPTDSTYSVSYENQLTLDIPAYWSVADSDDYRNATRRQHDFALGLQRVTSPLGQQVLELFTPLLFGVNQVPVIVPQDLFQSFALPLGLTLAQNMRYVPDAAQPSRALRFNLWAYSDGFLYADEPRQFLEQISSDDFWTSLSPVEAITAGDISRFEERLGFQDPNTTQAMEFRIVTLDTPNTDYFLSFIGDSETLASEASTIEQLVASAQSGAQPPSPVKITLDNLQFEVPINWQTITIPDASDPATWEGEIEMDFLTQSVQLTQADYDQFGLPIQIIWGAQITSLQKPILITLASIAGATPADLDVLMSVLGQNVGIQPISDEVKNPRDDLIFRIIAFENADAALWYIAIYVDGQGYIAQIVTGPDTLNNYADTLNNWLETFDIS